MDIVSIATSIVSLLGVIVALCAVWIQTRQNNLALGATILRDLEREFHWSEEMRNRRLALATFLLNRKVDDIPSSHVSDMLDFFDAIGLYHDKGVIDTEMTWVMFYYWVGHYWQLLKEDADYFERLDGGVTYYKSIRLLYTRLTKFGRKKRKLPREEEYFSTDDLQTFLETEIKQCSSRTSAIESPQTEAQISLDEFSPLLTFAFRRKRLWIGVTNRTTQRAKGPTGEESTMRKT